RKWIHSNLLVFLIFIGILLGFVIGFLVNSPLKNLRSDEDRKTNIMLIGFPGELFMNMLKLLMVPLVVASVICALAALDGRSSNRVSRRTFVYYLATTLLAVIIGVVLVTFMKPGSYGKPEGKGLKPSFYRPLDAVLDLIRSCFPSNIITAAFMQQRTHYTSTAAKVSYVNRTVNVHNMSQAELNSMRILSNGTHNYTTTPQAIRAASNTVPDGSKADSGENANILGLLVFSLVFGAVLGRMGERGVPLKALFESLNEVILKMLALVMWFAPIGVCSLIAAQMASMEDIMGSLSMLGLYMATVIAGLLAHALFILPLLFIIATRRNPLTFICGMRDALLTAFGTSSSTATLPCTIRCLEDRNRVDARISRFVLPLGSTVNMDGTALYEVVAAVFIAQIHGIELGLDDLAITCLTATAASIGASGIPQAGLVTMVMVLTAVNLPTEDIGLILSVDWFIDRIRTTVNVLGDAIGAGIVEHLSRDDLMNLDYTTREEVVPLDDK
ncbi:predicted protein, partial [Nematostella vectensis]